MTNESMATIVAVIALVSIAANLVQSFWLYKSVPREALTQFIAKARPLASATPTKADDIALDGLEYLAGQLPPHDPSENRS